MTPKVADVTNDAVLFRLDTDGSLHHILEEVSIANGMNWNEQNNTTFWTDTPTNNVYAFAITGNISNRRVFYHYLDDESAGNPGGHSRDVEGNIWLACYVVVR